MDSPVDISELSGSRIRACAEILAGAFFDMEPFVWLVPEPERRAHVFPVFSETLFRHAHPPGEGTLVAVGDNRVLGCAAWAAPGQGKAGFLRELASAWFMMRRLRLRELQSFGRRGSELQKAMLAVRPKEPHWYLAALAVDPHSQGSGIGSALMKAGLSRCDETAQAAYLECLEHLVPYYRRFGFERIHWIEMPEGTPRQAGMWRPPLR